MRKAKRKGKTVNSPKKGHVRHFDPIESIHDHVLIVIFISLMFMFGIFAFMNSTPFEPSVTGNTVLINYSAFKPGWDVGGSFSEFLGDVRENENRSFLILTFYTFWIVIFIAINGAMLEKQRKR